MRCRPGAVFGLVFLGAITRSCSDASSPATSTAASRATTPPMESAAAAAGSQSKEDPAALLSESKKQIDEIESRLKDNGERLKKYYGTSDQVKQATDDLIKLAVIKGLYENSRDKAEKSLSIHADALIQKVSKHQRAIFASAAEEIFVKNGMDVRVRAAGAKSDQLRLQYALMSQPLVYKFQNEMKFPSQAKLFGFKKIIYTDGYDETWTVNL